MNNFAYIFPLLPGSNHIREKDGMWAVLAWLSILAHYNTVEGVSGVFDLVFVIMVVMLCFFLLWFYELLNWM